MEQLITIFLSPMAFAIGFLWPLVTQSLIALGMINNEVQAIIVGAFVALLLGLMAQSRRSWIWIK